MQTPNNLSKKNKKKLFSRNKNGFRRGVLNATHLLRTIHVLSKILDETYQDYVVFLDFCKEFDRASHSKLLHKSKRIIINDNTIRWLDPYLTSRAQFVTVSSRKPQKADVRSGVPQESVIRPLLSLVSIKELKRKLRLKTKPHKGLIPP